MAREREVGTLWIGGPLSWLEQLCLKSFVDKGQKITLFSYEDIPNVPEGVIRRDGREIIDTDDFIKYEQKNSFALFADWFRLHMIHQCPGMIWIDTDVYCHRPMDYDSDYVMGYELPGEHRVNNAILGLPHDSEMLSQMLDFTSDRYSIAPFLPKGKQKDFRKKADAGKPVHITRQPWGVWGPMMVTHYVHALGLEDKVRPLDAFYPVTFRDRTKFLRRASIAEGLITDETTALHLWASNKKQLGNLHHGLAPRGSYLEKLVQEHGIEPALAPIKGRGTATFDGALVDHLDLDEVETVADLTGAARSFVLSLHHQHDCDIQLIDVDRSGQFGNDPQPWIADYAAFLQSNGVDSDRIRVIRREKDLRPVDVLCNLDGFGCAYRIKNLGRIYDRCLHSDSRVFMDIKKGSGAFPFLKAYGTNEPLSTREEDGKPVTRVVVTPKPPEGGDDAGWDEIATRLAGDDGFYRPGPEGHSFLFMPRSDDTLVVTFDNLDITMNKRDDRRPWGYSFIREQGWSMLGVLAGGWTWYRNPWVSQQFDELRDSGFFNRFKRVVFYGASMGGYAACAFSAAAPGADVVAISPQSTLDKSIVPWETRYKVAWDRDFSGPYGDAAQASGAANKVYVLYDPYEPLDSGHVARFDNDNVERLRAPLLGHRLGSSLNQMGILSPIILGALAGTLTSQDYYQMLRNRKAFPRYQRELFNRTVNRGHTQLAKSLGEYILARNDNRKVRQGLRALR
ncbi:hypothetical protein [Roseovarius sp. MMSF_3281]|uniref:hypothetical protein n=1 Tax=Roseovarius sp. MMSF_3281 TaxID=3046694 RepID=UPI00273DCDC1|nr:hypothetical protein [Roseovarius sp. MMSF_3281]